MAPECFTRNALDQIAQVRALGELLGHDHAEAGGVEVIGAVMHNVEAPAQRPPKSKNG